MPAIAYGSLLAMMAGSVGAACPATAQGLPAYAKTAEELATLPPTGGSGGSNNPNVRVVTLMGHPDQPGAYVQLLEVAPHTRIAAHHHQGDRVATVLKGRWMFGYGPRFDANGLRQFGPGSIYTEPSGGAHFAMTGDEPVVVEISGYGPTDTVYESAADDPLANAPQMKPSEVFDAYERSANAGDLAAIAKLISPTVARPLHYDCPAGLNDRDCLLNYLDETVIKRHSVLTTVSQTVEGDTALAKVELRNDATRRIGIDRITGTDKVTVVDGKITRFEFVRDETDAQTVKFFQALAAMPPR